MYRIELSAFADIIGGALTGQRAARYVSNVSIHSGRIEPETAFFALAGASRNGHRFVEDAFRNGAGAAVVARGWNADLSDRSIDPSIGPLIVVDDTLVALQKLARWWRSQLTGTIVGITGSNSKTMVKDALLRALSTTYFCAATPGSFNGQLGVPLAVMRTPQTAKVALFEAGISAPGEMERLERMIQPEYGILTNLRWAHISEFGSREHIAAEKAQLFINIPARGWALLPAGDPLSDRIAEGLRCRVHRYGSHNETVARDLPVVRRRNIDGRDTILAIEFPGGDECSLSIPSLQADVIAAIETALYAAYLLGVAPTQIAAALNGYGPVSTRLEVWKSPNGVTLIHAADNPDPLSVEAELRELETRSAPDGRRLFLLGGMTNLADAEYAGLGQLGAQHGVDELLLVGDSEFGTVEKAFLACSRKGTAVRFKTLATAREHLLAALRWGDTLLVKGSGLTGIDQIARDLIEAMAPNRFYVDLKAVQENLSRIRRLIGPDTRILAMLKALAYGGDAVQLSRGLQQMGIDQIGVSSADEGRQLRQAGISLPILVMMCTPDEVEKLSRYALTPVVYSQEVASAIIAAARAKGVAVDIHLEVDTGMGRLGVHPDRVKELVALVEGSGSLRLVGLMTHLACADTPDEDAATLLQLERFQYVRAQLLTRGYARLICHAAATAGALRFPESRFDMVRIGLGLYGLYPAPSVASSLELVPAVALVSRVVKITSHQRGDRIGYGGSFVVATDGFRAAVVPMGYHDGFPRSLSNVGYVLIQGHRAPICGRISMDSMVVDVTNIADAAVGADVLLYGERGGHTLRPEETAELSGTIVYELLARLGPRVQRILLGY